MSGSGLLLVSPHPPPPELARTLDIAGFRWRSVDSARPDDVTDAEPEQGWAGAVIAVGEESESGWGIARAVRRTNPGLKVLVLIGGAQLAELRLRDELFDDFCLTPFHPSEVEARLRHLLWSPSGGAANATPVGEMVRYDGLELNLETFQASIDGRPLDMTYMEYQLLTFLAQNPGKVFTREILLSRVWGYEYYGGARTVDVHVRRLRAKLGEEHANLIQTVRSVGYRFGQSPRWGA